MKQLLGLLANDEVERAEGIGDRRERRRFVVTRAALRNVLGRYTGEDPRRLHLERGPGGKPRLGADGGLRFNVSHSGSLAVIVVARDREVGVDVERVRPFPDALRIANRLFSPAERGALAALPPARRPAAFFQAWALREAWAKGQGDGVAQLLRHGGRPLDELTNGWSLGTLAVRRGYVAALAVERRAQPRTWFAPSTTHL
jgi:4'-phosphopantetheinyl transferase